MVLYTYLDSVTSIEIYEGEMYFFFLLLFYGMYVFYSVYTLIWVFYFSSAFEIFQLNKQGIRRYENKQQQQWWMLRRFFPFSDNSLASVMMEYEESITKYSNWKETSIILFQ